MSWRWRRISSVRAPNVVATALTEDEIKGSRISSVISVPSTATYSVAVLVLISRGMTLEACSTAAPSWRSSPVLRQYHVSARYIAPVSRYASFKRRATSLLTLDLPDPEGPSIAITSGLPGRATVSGPKNSRVITGVPAIHGRSRLQQGGHA